MRLWSVHPRYLDRQGLTACWREALLAQAVLAGRTRGYRAHSQLQRFRDQPQPVAAVGTYLLGIAEEAHSRGYKFDVSRVDVPGQPDAHLESPGRDLSGHQPSRPEDTIIAVPLIAVTSGQLTYEWHHLMGKLAHRSPDRHAALEDVTMPEVHPLFYIVSGPVAAWERL